MSENNSVIRSSQTKKFTSLSLDRDDLKKILDTLQLRANTACEVEVRKIDYSTAEPEVKVNMVNNLRTCATMKITVKGIKGEDFFGTIQDVFSNPLFPEQVTEVIVNSELLYSSNYKYYVDNFFGLYLNFTKHKVFDFSFQPSERTPNRSEFSVEGYDETWVTAVYNDTVNKLADKPSKIPFIHKGGIYDLILWIAGIPFAFGICYKITPIAERIFKGHTYLQNILYTYIFFMAIIFFRFFFQYVRWVYPMIEYKSKNNNTSKHQATIAFLGSAIIGSLAYDIVCLITKLFFK